MSITKFFEIRDSSTTLPLMVTKLEPVNSDEDWLIKRAMGSKPYPLFLVTFMSSDVSHFNIYNWGSTGARTVKTAHEFIEKNFDTLKTGDVIDVQVLLGEKETKKISENSDKLEYE